MEAGWWCFTTGRANRSVFPKWQLPPVLTELALVLLTNKSNSASAWNDKLIQERKRMDTGKYSMSENALSTDQNYQKIMDCGKFLSTMIPSGQFQDDYACH